MFAQLEVSYGRRGLASEGRNYIQSAKDANSFRPFSTSMAEMVSLELYPASLIADTFECQISAVLKDGDFNAGFIIFVASIIRRACL